MAGVEPRHPAPLIRIPWGLREQLLAHMEARVALGRIGTNLKQIAAVRRFDEAIDAFTRARGIYQQTPLRWALTLPKRSRLGLGGRAAS